MNKQEVIQHVADAQIQATVSVAATGTAWAALLANVNTVLITIATLIAIVSGVWALYDKIKARRGATIDESSANQQSRNSKGGSDGT